MDLEVVDALRAAGVPDDKARAVVASLHREIDQRYALHAAQLATRGDLADGIGGVKLAIAQLETKAMTGIAEMRVELIKWFLGSMIAMTGIILASVRVMIR
ncbi:MAG: hypothetical protein JO133_11670 [Burkholderiaceae bacterium]|nr:hypothetical protein [Burkholderiaceae bacterium]